MLPADQSEVSGLRPSTAARRIQRAVAKGLRRWTGRGDGGSDRPAPLGAADAIEPPTAGSGNGAGLARKPGIIAAPIRHSDQLHIVERFSLDPETLALRRDYVAEDPVYFVGEYAGSDTVLVADVPYEAHPCDELAPEFRQAGAPAAESRSEQ